MTIREKVALAISRGYDDFLRATPAEDLDDISPRQWAYRFCTDHAITAFLEAAAERGWHLRPDEATEEMGEAWAKLALDRIQKAVEGEMRTVGMVKGAKENYRAMLADPTAQFEWDKW